MQTMGQTLCSRRQRPESKLYGNLNGAVPQGRHRGAELASGESGREGEGGKNFYHARRSALHPHCGKHD